jgi:hypothetical protein
LRPWSSDILTFGAPAWGSPITEINTAPAVRNKRAAAAAATAGLAKGLDGPAADAGARLAVAAAGRRAKVGAFNIGYGDDRERVPPPMVNKYG